MTRLALPLLLCVALAGCVKNEPFTTDTWGLILIIVTTYVCGFFSRVG